MRPYKEKLRRRATSAPTTRPPPVAERSRSSSSSARTSTPRRSGCPASPTSSTSASSRARTAPTSPASPPPTTCSATADFDGAAPGAKLVSARACSWGGGCTAAALTDGMVDLVVNRDVDVVNMSIGGLPALNDGNNARAELYNRLIDDYGVQLVISAGNSGPGLNTIGDPSVATDVDQRRAPASARRPGWPTTARSSSKKNALFNFSSRGPREDGGFKPNIAAPGSAISTTPTWQPGSPVAEAGYPLPPGLRDAQRHLDGPPQATGAAALLLSAAKATDKGVTPAAAAPGDVLSSAKPIDGVPAYGQGNGLFNVPGAWELLRQGVETRRRLRRVGRARSAPPIWPEFLADPGPGHRHLQPVRRHRGRPEARPDARRTRSRSPDQRAGPAPSSTTVTLVGNDGTFNAPQDRRAAAEQDGHRHRRRPSRRGAHSAIIGSTTRPPPVVDFEVLNTVVVARTTLKKPATSPSPPGLGRPQPSRRTSSPCRRARRRCRSTCPGIATGSQTRFIAINPYGVPVDEHRQLACYTNFSDAAVCKPQERTTRTRCRGLGDRGRVASHVAGAGQPVQAARPGCRVSRSSRRTVELPDRRAPATPTPVTWTLNNTFGPVTVTGQGGRSASTLSAGRPSPTGVADQYHGGRCRRGPPTLDRRASATPATSAPTSTCTSPGRRPRSAAAADGDSEEAVIADQPGGGHLPGRGRGYAVAGRTSTAYDYRDVFYSAALGTLSAPATPVTLANGATATLTGTVTAQSAPAAGRQLSVR